MLNNIIANFEKNYFKAEFPNGYTIVVFACDNLEVEMHVSKDFGTKSLLPIKYLERFEVELLVPFIHDLDPELEIPQVSDKILEILEMANPA